MNTDLLFQFEGDYARPVLAHEQSGRLRRADGVTFFNVDQAAARSTLSIRELTKMHEAMWPPAADAKPAPTPQDDHPAYARVIAARSTPRTVWSWSVDDVATAHSADVARRLERLKEQFVRLADRDVELDLEEFAPILASIRTLQRAGVRFDRAMTVLVDKMADQAFGSPADGDSDVDVVDMENDDSNAGTAFDGTGR